MAGAGCLMPPRPPGHAFVCPGVIEGEVRAKSCEFVPIALWWGVAGAEGDPAPAHPSAKLSFALTDPANAIGANGTPDERPGTFAARETDVTAILR